MKKLSGSIQNNKDSKESKRVFFRGSDGSGSEESHSCKSKRIEHKRHRHLFRDDIDNIHIEAM